VLNEVSALLRNETVTVLSLALPHSVAHSFRNCDQLVATLLAGGRYGFATATCKFHAVADLFALAGLNGFLWRPFSSFAFTMIAVGPAGNRNHTCPGCLIASTGSSPRATVPLAEPDWGVDLSQYRRGSRRQHRSQAISPRRPLVNHQPAPERIDNEPQDPDC
jgi:hypothetical protein